MVFGGAFINQDVFIFESAESIIDENLFKYECELKNNIIDTDINKINEYNTIVKAGKKINKLPDNCNITIDMIPKYCYFQPETDKRGCKFIIDKHPNLVSKNIRSIGTSESNLITIEFKFKCLLELLNIIEDNSIELKEFNEKIKDIKKKYK